MSRLNLLIADTDKYYAGSLASYMVSVCSEVFNVMCCTSGAFLQELLGNGTDIDILLICTELYMQQTAACEIPCVIVLAEGTPIDGFKDINTVNKYQHAKKLVDAITAIFSGRPGDGAGLSRGGGSAALAAVYSASGGTGKTSVAQSIAAMCGHLGKSVLYISLESFDMIGCFSSQTGAANLSNIIYHLKSGVANLLQKICNSCTFDPESRIWFIPPPDSALDLEELNCRDMGELLGTIKGMGRFDLIIVDMPGSFNKLCQFIMEECDELIIVSAPGYRHEERLRLFACEVERLEKRKSLGIAQKVVHVQNKSVSNSTNPVTPLFDGISTPVVVLPKISEIAGIRKPFEFLRLPEEYTSSIKLLAARYMSREGK